MRVSRILLTLSAIGAVAASASSQCEPAWSSLGGHAGVHPRALAAHDEDGAGPGAASLFVGGGLGDIEIIARWDGWKASAVGDGAHESYVGLECFSVVPGQVGGLPVGLYAGGEISLAGSVHVNNLARWDEGEWHDVGGGVSSPFLLTVARTLTVFDEDGEGPLPPSLFVGAVNMEIAGGELPVEALVRWDGMRWSEIGGGLANAPGRLAKVNASVVYDDGRGPALYVAGSFNSAGGKECWNIARWDGVEWEPVGPGLATTVNALSVFDEDGPGPKRPALFAGGAFSRVRGGERGTLMSIGRWDGAEWSAVGGWNAPGATAALAVWDEDGPGPAQESLYIGGSFNRLPDGTTARKIARWNGEQWHRLGEGVSGFGLATGVDSLAVFDEDGPGPNPGGLYVGGLFLQAGEVEAAHIARWGCPLPPTPCYADCDGDGELAFFDFLCFQNQFAAGATLADCDYSGDLDFFDFLCFQNAFAAGCP